MDFSSTGGNPHLAKVVRTNARNSECIFYISSLPRNVNIPIASYSLLKF